MAAAGIPAALSSLYICEGLLLSPLEVLRTKKQLDATNRKYDAKQSILKGHLICFARSIVQSFVTLSIESTYYTGFFGILAGVLASHPLDTLRTRLAISDRSAGELIKNKPYAGLLWNCLYAVPYHWLSRLCTGILSNIVGLDEAEAPWWLRSLAFAIVATILSPLTTFRRLDQAALVSTTKSGEAPETGVKNAVALIKEVVANPKKLPLLFAGASYNIPEVFTVVLLRRFLTDLFFFPLVYIIYGPKAFEGPGEQ